MLWEYDKEKECWIAWDENIEYLIEGNEMDGYTAFSTDYEWGIDKIAVSFNFKDKSETRFTNLEKLKKRIENKTQYWLYENGEQKGLTLKEK